jgi:fatty acid desaturase
MQNSVKKSIWPTYLLNQVIFGFNLTTFIISWILIFNNTFGVFGTLLAIINCICLHYFFTTIHQSTHRLLSSNHFFNHLFGFVSAIFGGITFADFSFTHLIHHSTIGHKENDPDHLISGSKNVLSIPFKIWLHDYYFWTHKTSPALKISYLLSRSIQFLIVVFLFVLTSKTNLFVYYWLVPMLIVGLFNSYFLFYIPHYQIKGFFWNTSLGKHAIFTSRHYHHLHHDNPEANQNYFPLELQLACHCTNSSQYDLQTKKYMYD